MSTFSLTGITGKQYTFTVYDANTTWNDVPGLYALVTPQGVPKYIGETQSFASRRPGPSHEKWTQAQRLGATIILAMVTAGGEAVRLAAEKDLIQSYNPPLNKQLSVGASLLTGASRPFGAPRRTL